MYLLYILFSAVFVCNVLGNDIFPTNFDWRNVNGQNWVTSNRNQHRPNYCGSCYAFAATSSLSDRFKIQSKGQFPEHNLSPQVILNCLHHDPQYGKTYGCAHGGDPWRVYEYIHNYGVPDETCQRYSASAADTGNTCADKDICINCNHDGCWAQPSYYKFYAKEYGKVYGEHNMLNEIVSRGPIVCGMHASSDFHAYKGGIFNGPSGGSQNHYVSLTGFGVDPNTNEKYWIGRNQWGTYWGEEGFFRIARGADTLGIERNCTWAIPGENKRVNIPISKEEEDLAAKPLELPEMPDENDSNTIINPWTNEDTINLPQSWDWRNVSGISFATWNKNQHIPTYCGSCWLHATTSSISDRLAILRKNSWPAINISVQSLLYCSGAGTCHGGSSLDLYRHVYKYGAPDETCQQYIAEDGKCTAEHMCQNCVPEIPGYWPGNCTSVSRANYDRWYLSHYGIVHGDDQMKAEIKNRGPISCSMHSTVAFHNYTGGIYSEHVTGDKTNHVVQIAGWGVEDGVEYWIGRNSWGSYWGEWGWFKLNMHHGNMLINKYCTWGVPKLH